eukprot:2274123-Amphidinium_carterae.1
MELKGCYWLQLRRLDSYGQRCLHQPGVTTMSALLSGQRMVSKSHASQATLFILCGEDLPGNS